MRDKRMQLFTLGSNKIQRGISANNRESCYHNEDEYLRDPIFSSIDWV